MINQDLRWIPSKPTTDGTPMMVLQYSFWDVEKGGYVWKNVPYVNQDGTPVVLKDDFDEDKEGEEWKDNM